MTGGGITWNRGEIGPCRFGYFTLPVNLVAGVKSFKSSSETFMSELMTTPRAANRAPSRLSICSTSDLRQGTHFSGLPSSRSIAVSSLSNSVSLSLNGDSKRARVTLLASIEAVDFGRSTPPPLSY
jgi:hypothetical protein